jgi:hypothetical protein
MHAAERRGGGDESPHDGSMQASRLHAAARENDLMRRVASKARVARNGVNRVYPGKTASILVFNVAALNGLTM